MGNNNCCCSLCFCCCPNSRSAASSGTTTTDLCCNRKITWPIVIGLFHVAIYLTVIVFNTLNLVQAVISIHTANALGNTDGTGEIRLINGENQSNRRKMVDHHHDSDPGDNLNDTSTDLSSEWMIVHSICILILATVGCCISFNLLLLKESKLEIARSLRWWLVYTVVFCVLVVPYYVWRLSTSEHVGRWLIQLVGTNATEGYFLGIAYSLITELEADPSKQLMGRESSKFRGLQSRESQITFVGEVTNLKTFTEIKI